MGFLRDIRCPVKFAYYRKRVPPGPRILDVGCGNHSPSVTKRWFPGCYYVGADIARYNLTDADEALIDWFVPVTADGCGYDVLPDETFDLIILSHVIEHMSDPLPLVTRLCAKLKRGGFIWLSFPSLRSLSLPSAIGSLQYCDDPTHVRIVDVKDVGNALLDGGVAVIHAGRSRNFPRFVQGFLRLPFAFAERLMTGQLHARGLWYVLGFEDHVLGVKR